MNEYEPNPKLQNLVKQPPKDNKKPILILVGVIVLLVFIIFIPIHIYMASWNAVKFPGSGIDTIISGLKFEKDEQH